MANAKARELIMECRRQFESCLYTSTALHILLRTKRLRKGFFITAPLVLAGVSSWKVFSETNLAEVKWVVSICSLIAGLIPSIYSALKIEENLKDIADAAAEFTNLRDRFRQVGLVWSKKPFAEFESEFERRMKEMEDARSRCVTVPEWAFRRAQKKVKKGDYDFDVDVAAKEAGQE